MHQMRISTNDAQSEKVVNPKNVKSVKEPEKKNLP
jgi:hypothetical protein